jgi:CRISPR system Cascade subunit CasC
MKIELHLLQNFAPSNLNRDDTGAPKDCELGGYRRARISSQCQKRAVREAFRLEGLIAEGDLAARTKRLVHEVAAVLVREFKHPEADARAVALGALEGVGLGRNKKGTGEDAWKTQYLLFIPRRIVAALAGVLHAHWEKLVGMAVSVGEDEVAPTAESEPAKGKGGKAAKKDAKAAKKDAKAAYPKDVQKAVEKLLQDARSSADLGLFGRMIADKPEWNVEASCQVAQAISTHKVQMDFDFFTAVDDFKPGDTAGSDMMGTVQFNSSCFYRYAVLDVAALASNLDQGDAKEHQALLRTAVLAFLQAFSSAIPTGKQNSMAAHNPPSYILAVVREKGAPVALTNAFLKPARPRVDQGVELDLVDDSIDKLERYLERMEENLEGATLLAWADRDIAKPARGVQRKGKRKELFAEVLARAVGGGS